MTSTTTTTTTYDADPILSAYCYLVKSGGRSSGGTSRGTTEPRLDMDVTHLNPFQLLPFP